MGAGPEQGSGGKNEYVDETVHGGDSLTIRNPRFIANAIPDIVANFRPNLEYRVDRKSIYHGRVIDLDVERVTLPNGAEAELEIVRHPGGAAVVALDGEQRVCLLRQFRYAAGGWLWELPAGKLAPGEPPRETAVRELEEEAGLRAKRWEALGHVISSPGVFTEVVHLFLARDLVKVPANHEPHELIEVHWLPFAEAIARVHAGDFIDGKTVIGLLRAQHVLTG